MKSYTAAMLVTLSAACAAQDHVGLYASASIQGPTFREMCIRQEKGSAVHVSFYTFYCRDDECFMNRMDALNFTAEAKGRRISFGQGGCRIDIELMERRARVRQRGLCGESWKALQAQGEYEQRSNRVGDDDCSPWSGDRSDD